MTTPSPTATGRVQPDSREPTGVRVDFQIPLREIDRGVDIHEDLPAVWLNQLLTRDLPDDEMPWNAAAPGRVDVTIAFEAGMVRMRGTGRFTLAQSCVRCLESLPFEVPVRFDLRLAEAGPEWDGTGVIDLDPQQLASLIEDENRGDSIGEKLDAPEDIDMATYRDGVVDVATLLREQLFLELPHYPTCESKLAVLKEPCTFDLAAAMKGEEERWVASRWSGLEAFRTTAPEGSGEDES